MEDRHPAIMNCWVDWRQSEAKKYNDGSLVESCGKGTYEDVKGKFNRENISERKGE